MKYILLSLAVYFFYRFFIKRPDNIAAAETKESLNDQRPKQKVQNEDEYIDYEEVD